MDGGNRGFLHFVYRLVCLGSLGIVAACFIDRLEAATPPADTQSSVQVQKEHFVFPSIHLTSFFGLRLFLQEAIDYLPLPLGAVSMGDVGTALPMTRQIELEAIGPNKQAKFFLQPNANVGIQFFEKNVVYIVEMKKRCQLIQ